MRTILALCAALFLSFTGCDQHQALGRNDNGTCVPGLTSCGGSCVDTSSNVPQLIVNGQHYSLAQVLSVANPAPTP